MKNRFPEKLLKNPKAFFAYARSKLKSKDGIADLDQDDEGTASTREAKVDVTNAFFSSVSPDNLLTTLPPPWKIVSSKKPLLIWRLVLRLWQRSLKDSKF